MRILGGHSFLWHGTLIFNCIFCIQSNLELTFLHVVVFDIKCHNSYFMKCLHNNIGQNDTIW